jgi:PTS system nitrogen regulatory IIA component
MEGLAHVVGLVARLATPIDFQAIDGMPVDLVFLLLSPPDAGVEHLKALARVSRKLRDRAFVAKLRGAGSPDALYALFAHTDTRDAA